MGSELPPSESPHRMFREAEESFRLLVERIEDYAIFMLDPQGRIISWNIGAQRVHGYPDEEILGKHYSTLFATEDVQSGVPARMLEVASAEGYCESQGWRLRKDGTHFFSDVVVTALRDKEGRLQGFAKITRDVTKKKQQEERLRMTVEAAPNAMIMTSPKGRIVLVNAQTEKLLGYRREELLDHSIEMLIPERVRLQHSQDRARYMLTPSMRPMGSGRDLCVRRKDGVEVPVEIGLNPLRWEEGVFVLASLVDLTERKRTEVNQGFLVEATNVLSSTFDVTVSLPSVARLIVPRFADLCLIDFVDAKRALVRAAAAHSDPDVQARFQRLVPPGEEGRARTEARSVSRAEDLVEVAPDSEHLALLREIGVQAAVVAPLRSGDRAMGTITLASGRPEQRYDSTDVGLFEELARRVSIAIENSRHYREANEAVRARNEFLSIASHELKTPLTTLQLQLQVLQRQWGRSGDGKLTSGELRDGLGILRGQVQRLTSLINALLDVSRIAAGKFKLSPDEVDFAQIVREVAKRHQEETEQKGIRVDLRLPDSVVGFWDRLRLDQVVTNLLTNALKYGDGKPVTVTLEQDRDEARLTVQDSGMGIRPEDQTRIFQPFERAASPWHISGLGMGLHIVRQIVEAHGGRIAVQSTPRMGSTFVVELPLRRLAPAEVAGP